MANDVKPLKVKSRKGDFEQKYPIEGTVIEGESREANDDNFFLKYSKEEIAKKSIQMNVLLSFMTDILELEDRATFEMMANRIIELQIRSRSI